MKIKDILESVEKNRHPKVKIAFTDIDGILRGKFIHKKKFLESWETGPGFCDVVFGWDSSDEAYDNVKATGWHTGYPDAQLHIDLSTYRTIPWEEDMPLFLADFEKDTTFQNICPRSLLKRVVAKAKELGMNPQFSQEFEWFNFKRGEGQTPITEGMFGYSLLRLGQNSDFLHDLFDLLDKLGVPLEGLHTETGPGVMEAAIQYTEPIEAADRAVLFKWAVKEIAHRYDIAPSFMAKWHAELPGCSGHIHQSMWDAASTKNLFQSEKEDNTPNALLKSYLAGQLHGLPHLLPMYAPTINSYKRLVEGAWAPTTLTWGMDNRTTALRVILGGKGSRLENRVVGSDANPYLAMAASLASGLYGLENKLALESPQTIGNGYAHKENGVLPANLLESARTMAASEIAEALLGKNFVEHFCQTRLWEWRRFGQAVTDWELKRYFEII